MAAPPAAVARSGLGGTTASPAAPATTSAAAAAGRAAEARAAAAAAATATGVFAQPPAIRPPTVPSAAASSSSIFPLVPPSAPAAGSSSLPVGGAAAEPVVVDASINALPMGSPPPRRPASRTTSQGDSPEELGGGSSSWASVSPSDVPLDAEMVDVGGQGSDGMGGSLVDARMASLLAGTADRPPPPPNLVPQSLVDSIGTLLASSGAEGAHEALVVVLHTILAQSGFVLSNSSGHGTAASKASAPRSMGAPPLPASWRATPGLYSLSYGHVRQSASSAGGILEIKCVPMGPMVLVHAMLLVGGGAAVSSRQLEPSPDP